MKDPALAELQSVETRTPGAPWRAGKVTKDTGRLHVREVDIKGRRHVALWFADHRLTSWVKA